MFLISDLINVNKMRDSNIAISSNSQNSDSQNEFSEPDSDLDDEKSVFRESCEQYNVKTPKHQKKDNQSKYKCPFEGCSSAFPRPWRLQNHIEAHKGQKSYKCTEEGCDKAYTSNSHLVRHVAQTHIKSNEQKQAHPCQVKGCGKVLKTRDILAKHMVRFHSERRFSCSVCTIKFRTQEQLESHSKHRHNDLSSHRCEQCNLKFQRLGPYRRHMRGHRLHLCHVLSCLYVTDDYSLLRRHIAAAHPKSFQCNTCGNEFKMKSSLKRHIDLHLAQEGLLEARQSQEESVSFNCSSCHLSLATRASLKRHVRLIHETPAELRTKKTLKSKARAVRKDKNLPKQSIAAKLAQVTIPSDIEKAILSKDTYSAHDGTSQRVYDLMLKDLQTRNVETV